MEPEIRKNETGSAESADWYRLLLAGGNDLDDLIFRGEEWHHSDR